jgi:hypothetical protein
MSSRCFGVGRLGQRSSHCLAFDVSFTNWHSEHHALREMATSTAVFDFVSKFDVLDDGNQLMLFGL